MSAEPDPHQRVHDALGGLLDDGEFALNWVVVIDIAGPDGARYLAHRAGGGADGSDKPMAWTALGMMQAAARLAEDQVVDATEFTDDDDGDDE